MGTLKGKNKETYVTVVMAGYIVAAVIAAFFMVMVLTKGHQPVDFFYGEEQLTNIKEGWILTDGEDRKPINLPSRNEVEISNNKVTLENVLPNNIGDQDVILYRSSLQSIEILIDGESVYLYGQPKYRRFGRDNGSLWNIVRLKREFAGKEIKLVIESPYKDYKSTFNAFYIGTYPEVFDFLFKVYQPSLVVAFSLLVVGFFLVTMYIACLIVGLTRNRQTLWLGLFSATVAVWELTECKLTQLIYGNIVATSNLGFLALGLMVIPLLFYFNDIQRSRYKKLHYFMVFVAEVNFLVQIIFQVAGVWDFYEMLIVSHIIIALVSVLVVGTSISCFHIDKEKGMLPFMFALFLLAVAGIAEIINMYITGLANGIFLSLSVFLYVLTCSVKTFMNIIALVNEGIEAQKESAAKTMFLANMSHEIRTPMNAICAMSEMLVRSNTVGGKDKENAEVIYEAALNLLDIVNDILDYTKISSDKMELSERSYNLNRVIYDACNPIMVIAKLNNLEFKVTVSPNVHIELFGDDGKIRQLLINLLSNAVKYTPKGMVSLCVDCNMVDEKSAELTFTVSDTGVGIKQSDLDKLFDAFAQVDPRRSRDQKSTGLGLAISQGIATIMGGTITVESELGKGSTFKASIIQKTSSDQTYEDFVKKETDHIVFVDDRILYVPPRGKEWELSNNTEKLDASKASVMVVDDNSTNLRIMREILTTYGIKPILVASGPQAIVVTQTKHVDLIFMDHMMPDMDGIEATKIIRELPENRGKNIKIIALTANAMKGNEEIFLNSGFDAFVPKPVSIDQVKNILLKYLDDDIIKTQ